MYPHYLVNRISVTILSTHNKVTCAHTSGEIAIVLIHAVKCSWLKLCANFDGNLSTIFKVIFKNKWLTFYCTTLYISAHMSRRNQVSFMHYEAGYFPLQRTINPMVRLAQAYLYSCQNHPFSANCGKALPHFRLSNPCLCALYVCIFRR